MKPFTMKSLLLIGLIAIMASCDEEEEKEKQLPDVVDNSSNWARQAGNPLIKAGITATGSSLALSVSDPCVIYDSDAQLWKMWMAIGWFEGDDFRTGIKYAESLDGLSWSIATGLALGPANESTAWDYTSCETPMVVKTADGQYMLWYSGGNININPLGEDYPRFQIGAARSADGKSFERISAAESPYGKAGLVLMVHDAFPALPSVATGVVADPSVIYHMGSYQMWFTSIGLTENDEDVDGGVGFASSADGINWTAANDNPLQSLKRMNEDFVAQPSVLYNASTASYEMWFNADYPAELAEVGANGTLGFWHASSTDGLSWTVDRDNGRDFSYSPESASEQYGLSVGACVVLKDGSYWMYYGGLASGSYAEGFSNPWPYAHVINLATATH